MNNLTLRILTGLVYVSLTVAILLWGGKELLLLYMYLLSFFCYHEYIRLNMKEVRFSELAPSLLVTPVVFSLIFLSGWGENGYTYVFSSALFIPIIQQLFTRREDPVKFLGVIFTGYILITLPFALLTAIATLNYPDGPEISNGIRLGVDPYKPEIILAIFIFLWVSDSFAYVGGKLFGHTKLAPAISPGKTIEGLATGLVMTNISAMILHGSSSSGLTLSQMILLSNICVISGLIGDLLISRIKRSLGIKDSGKSLPGHGGFLDRFDSLLLAAPAAFFYLKAILLFN